MAENTLFCWSSGKDSAMALHELLLNPQRYNVTALLTTVTADYERVSMHGVRHELLDAQALAMRLPLHKVTINSNDGFDEYATKMQQVLTQLKNTGISHAAFGDIFLQDLREYRETSLAQIGMQAVFPLWQRNTAALARDFIRNGFQAIITCVDTQALDSSFCGCAYDDAFLDRLPPGVDPCGENGEFHTFVWSGPIFAQPARVIRGEKVLRDNRFCFCDLLPDGGNHAEC